MRAAQKIAQGFMRICAGGARKQKGADLAGSAPS
jgi:hypothetical protein